MLEGGVVRDEAVATVCHIGARYTRATSLRGVPQKICTPRSQGATAGAVMPATLGRLLQAVHAMSRLALSTE